MKKAKPPKVWPGAGGANKPRPRPPEPTLGQIARRLDAIEKRLDLLERFVNGHEGEVICLWVPEMPRPRTEKKPPRPARDKKRGGR